MSRIAKILERVRDSLADHGAERWSDARLLRLLDEGQVDIAVKNNLLRTKADISVVLDQNTYSLPSNAARLTRIVDSSGEVIPIRSHAQMDEIDPLWEVATGTAIEYIVFDKLEPGQFKVYPIPEASDIADTFTTDAYGLTADITDDTLTAPYGIVVDINESATLYKEFSSIYGVVTDMSAVLTSIVVYYNKRPAEIDAIDLGTSILEIHDIYDKALKHYVVGMAWRDDQDTQNRSLGIEELKFYMNEFDEANKNSSSDNVSSSKQRIQYNDGFN